MPQPPTSSRPGPNRAAARRGRPGYYAGTGAVADRYWLTLDPSPVNPPPGLRGRFAQGRLTPFPPGQAPCAAA